MATEINRHTGEANSVPQTQPMELNLWDVLDKKSSGVKRKLMPMICGKIRGFQDLWDLLPAGLFPDINHDDAVLWKWVCGTVVKREWEFFFNLENKQKMKSFIQSEGESPTMEYIALKYHMLKYAISASKGVRERIELIEDGARNIADATLKESRNLMSASLKASSNLAGKRSQKTVSDLRQGKGKKVSRRDTLDDCFEEGDDEPPPNKKRPSAKRSREALPDRDDANEDSMIEEYDSDDIGEVVDMISGSSGKKQKRAGTGRQTSHAAKQERDDAMFQTCFDDIKDMAKTQMQTQKDMMELATTFFNRPAPAPAPAPAPDPGIAALLQMAGMYFQNASK
jgi:hypothetical protein